jgi:hypothetical protein
MPQITLTQLALVTILIITCIVSSFSTDHNSRAIRNQIAEAKEQLAALRKEKGSKNEKIVEAEKSLTKLKEELSKVESFSYLPKLSGGESLSAKLRSSLPYIIMITVGVIVGAVVIVLIPIILIVVLFTLATFVGSSGLFSEFIRSESKALAVSVIPAGLYALTQVFVLLQLYGLFDLMFWVFDIVVVLTLVGVSMIFGKELQLEIVLVLVAILAVWDIYAVIFSPIMGTSISKLAYTLFSVLIPNGSGYSLIGGGDFFFSCLLVTSFTRRLKAVPVALVLLIGASVMGLILMMAITGQTMAPALPAVLAAGLVSVVYYRRRIRN